MRLKDKIAIVLGANSAIGRAVATRLTDDGARVVAADHHWTAHIERVDCRTVDLNDEPTVRSLMAGVGADLGRLDILCLCQSLVGPIVALDEMATDDFDRVLSENVRSVFLAMKYATPQLRASGGGAIVTIGTVGAFRANAGMSAYHTAKGAILMLTKAAAIDYASAQIRVNLVCPGTIESELLDGFAEADLERLRALHPVQRLGSPEEVAGVVAYLSSDEAAFITGTSITIDGGRMALLGSRPGGGA